MIIIIIFHSFTNMCDTSPVKKKNKAPVQPHYKSGNEYKKKTGITVDELGRVVTRKGEQIEDDDDPDTKILNNGQNNNEKPKKVYNSTDEYKPTGKLIYNPDFFEKIENKIL